MTGEENQKKCLECGDVIYGRSDKKFCSDQCRNTHNNRQNSDANNTVRNINNTLRKNRRILDQLCKGDKQKISRDRLLSEGFSLTYHTHQYATKAGAVYHFCYEMGYLPLDNDEVLIVRRESSTG